MSVSVLEKVNNRDERFSNEREKFFINKMNTKYKGMNRKYNANCISFLKTFQ
jgi:hypothetical protein